MVDQIQSINQMKFLKNFQSTKLDYLRVLVNINFHNKKNFLEFLSQELSIKISKTSTYPQILEIISLKTNTKKLSKKIAGVDDLDCLVARYDIENGLLAFSPEELLEIAEYMRIKNPKWKYKETPMKELITSISVILGREEFQSCLNELFLQSTKGKGSLKSVHQNDRWTVGPYGTLRSTSKRTSSFSNDLIRFFSKNMNGAVFIEFLKIIEIPPKIIPSKKDPLLTQKSIQIIFSICDDNLIFKTLNSLIDKKLIKIDCTEKYWDFYATPCGLFKETYGVVVNALAELLIKEIPEQDLDIELNRKEIREGTLKMKVLELCLKKNPSNILSDLFGFPALRRIARNLFLVSVESISDRKNLIDLILLKLGFKIPPKLIGIKQYQEKLLNYKAQIMTSISKKEEKIGIMTDIYSQTERILKDLIYFYTTNIWIDDLDEYEPEKKLDAVDSIIMKKVGNNRKIQKASFGILIRMLHNINNLIKNDKQIKKEFIKKFHRSELLDRSHFKALEKILPYRAQFTHDKKDKQITKQNCIEIIDVLSSLVSDLKKKSVYPYNIRISREIFNEYGVNYIEAIDEWGIEWTIKADEWIETELSYFMISRTKPTAIEPIIVEKFW